MNLYLETGILDWELGFGIGDWDWGLGWRSGFVLGIGIGEWDWGIGIRDNSLFIDKSMKCIMNRFNTQNSHPNHDCLQVSSYSR